MITTAGVKNDSEVKQKLTFVVVVVVVVAVVIVLCMRKEYHFGKS